MNVLTRRKVLLGAAAVAVVGFDPGRRAWASAPGGGVIAIPKAARETHLRENLAAGALRLDRATCDALDALFPPPRRATPLSIT